MKTEGWRYPTRYEVWGIWRVVGMLLGLLLGASSAYADLKVAPTQAEPGHPFTLIDAPNQRIVDGSLAVFRLFGLETIVPLRTHKPYNTAQGRLSSNMFGGVYTVLLRQPNGNELEVGDFTVLGPSASPPFISPDVGPRGTPFVVTDALARIQAGDVAVFYPEGMDPSQGALAPGTVSVDGRTLSGTVPNGAVQGAQNFVSVRPAEGASRFGDLGFFVTRTPLSIEMALRNVLDSTTSFAPARSSLWSITGTVSNRGTVSWDQHDLSLVLPAGLRVADGLIVFEGAALPCIGADCESASLQTYAIGRPYAPGQERSFAFTVAVGDVSAGLYPVDARSRGTVSSVTADISVPNAVIVPVGAVRTRAPTINCPIGRNDSRILGTSEPNAGISVLFNGIVGGSGTADASGAWTVTNHVQNLPLSLGTTVQAVASAPGRLMSVPSATCVVADP
jgi:hypothetical protein